MARGRRFTNIERLKALRASGLSYAKVASTLGVALNTVKRHLGVERLPDRRGRPKLPPPAPRQSGIEFRDCEPYWCDPCRAMVGITPCPACVARAGPSKEIPAKAEIGLEVGPIVVAACLSAGPPRG